jgi:hypothetical protein
VAHLWALTYEPLVCATCGYNMGMREPDSNDTGPVYCGEHVPAARATGQVDHLLEMARQGGISPEQLLNTLLSLARGGGEDAGVAAKVVGGNPHALDAAAMADGGFVGAAGSTFDTPLPPPPKAGPNDPPVGAPPPAQVAVVADSQGKPRLVDPMKIVNGLDKP